VNVNAIAVVCFANACFAVLPMRLLALRVQSSQHLRGLAPDAGVAKRSRSRRGVGRLDRFTSAHLHLLTGGNPNGRQRALAFVPASEAEVTSTARRPQHAA
jgi:hypothetical protein